MVKDGRPGLAGSATPLKRATATCHAPLFLLACLCVIPLAACTHTASKPWGAEATFSPGWQVVKRSAVGTLRDRSVWMPLAGAALFGATNLDHQVSDYAMEHKPVFGNKLDALRASDDLLDASRVSLWLTTLATPNTDRIFESMQAKAKGIVVQASAIVLTNNLTGELKRQTGRVRPEGIGDDSLPSAHASGAFVYTSLSRHNMRYITQNSAWHQAADIGLLSIASATAWARIEGEVHYPSDVLLGAALGNFFARFVNTAFLHPKGNDQISLDIQTARQATSIRFKVSF